MKEYNVQGTIRRFHLFEKITKQKEAYLIGYLAGDGGYAKHTHKRKARLRLSSSYEPVIDYLVREFCPEVTVSSHVPINKQRNIVSKRLSYRMTFPAMFHDTFNKFGILSLKKERVIVNIPKKFMPHYLVGLLDADGHISFGHRKDRNRLWANIGFTHQSIKLLVTVQTFLDRELGISSGIAPRSDEDCYDLKFSSLESVKKFLEYIYKDVEFCNKKKKGKADRLCHLIGLKLES